MSNVYLHYAFDLWVQQWRKRYAHGEVYVVRYADDIVLGFQKEQDARAMRMAMAERLAKFGLELHPDKTRVLRFGRFARRDGERDGRVKPETFDFLGFTHIAGQARDGKFKLIRRTSRKKRTAKLQVLRAEIRRRRHESPAETHRWLCSVIRGHVNYYGVPTNYPAMMSFRSHVEQQWHRQLQRRSQLVDGRWNRGNASGRIFPFRFRTSFTPGRTCHALARRPKVGARCGKSARRALSGGRPERAVPTGTRRGESPNVQFNST
jgi:hypothetical protein